MLMHDPPTRPGRALREYLGEMEIAEAVRRLRVTRTTLSRVINGRAGISAAMSLRLSAALGSRAAFCAELQMDYDLWKASKKRCPKIPPFREGA